MSKPRTFVGVVLGLLTAVFVSACAATPPPGRAATTGQTRPLPTPGPGAVAVHSARLVSEVIGDDQAHVVTIAPNGKQIAWFNDIGAGKERNGRLCLFTFENAAKACHDFPQGKFLGYPYQLQWSPDSSKIAFSENPFQLAYESDIWVLDVASGRYTDVTDDGLTGAATKHDPATQPVDDYLPMWNASDGQIYFWRLTPLGSLKYTLGLYKIAPIGGKPVQVRDFTTTLPGQFPYLDYEKFIMDGPSAISPDGGKLAVLMPVYTDTVGTNANLWLIDLKQVDAAPQRLMTFADFQKAIPAWSPYPAVPMGFSWTADGKGLVAVASSFASDQTPFMPFYYITPSDKAFRPVVDFSTLVDQSAYFAQPEDGGLSLRAYSPWTGSLTPKGDKLLMLNDLTGVIGLFTAALPPSGGLPVVSAAKETLVPGGITRSSRSSDGKVIIYGLLLNLQEK